MSFDRIIAPKDKAVINKESLIFELENHKQPTNDELEPFYKSGSCPPLEYNFPIILYGKVGKAVPEVINRWTNEYGPMPYDKRLQSLPAHQRAEIYKSAVQSYLGTGSWKRLAEITVKSGDSNREHHGQKDVNYKRAQNYKTLTTPTLEYNCMAPTLGMCPFYPNRETRRLFEEISQYYGFGVTHKPIAITHNWNPANLRNTKAFDKYLEAVNALDENYQNQAQKAIQLQLEALTSKRPLYIPAR